MKISIASFLIFICLLIDAPLAKEAKRAPDAHWPKGCPADQKNLPKDDFKVAIKETLSQLNHSIYELKNEETSKIFYPSSLENIPFVAVVVHGLNLKPSKMASLEKTFLDQGAIVLRVALEGHRGSLEEQKAITWERWQNQFHDHYCLAQKIGRHFQAPLLNLSFSLGALVSLGHVANQEKWPYFKTIFIAPAAWIHWYGNIPSWFDFLGRGIGIPSKNLVEYRAEATTSLAAYESMAQGRREINEIPLNLLRNKTLIIIDPDDELVSLKKISEFIKEKRLKKYWSTFKVNNKENQLKKSYHHLIIDKKSLGKNQWNSLQQRVLSFLEG